MLFYTGLIFLVIAVSLDSLGVGVAYGMRKVQVPIHALLIIMLCSGIVVVLSMTIGKFLMNYLSPDHASIVGGVILIFLGFFSLYNLTRSKQANPSKETKFKTVLLSPEDADLDDSGIISTGEAILLGIALSLDAFGAGIAASVIGYSLYVTPLLISIMSGLFVYSGIQIGFFLSKNKKLQKVSYISPALLILLGIFNML